MRGLASKTEGRRESQGGLEEGAPIWVFAKIAMSGCYKSDEHADDHNSTLLSVQELGCGTYGPSRSETASGVDPLPNQLVMEIGVTVNYGDSVLVISSVNGQRLRMRIAGAQPESVREGATITVGWKLGDEHLIPR